MAGEGERGATSGAGGGGLWTSPSGNVPGPLIAGVLCCPPVSSADWPPAGHMHGQAVASTHGFPSVRVSVPSPGLATVAEVRGTSGRGRLGPGCGGRDQGRQKQPPLVGKDTPFEQAQLTAPAALGASRAPV